MRKILSIFAAVLVALVANADVINITNETPDALRLALNGASDADVIVMAAGTYVESNGDYIAFDGKAVTVRAAEGAEVIIQPQVPITVSNGGHAIFENVKIDASRLTELATWYEHLLYVNDANPNGFTFRECEIYGFNLNSSMFYCNNANKVAAAKFEGCYFHDIMKSILFVENPAGKPMVSVRHCTFANISTNTESYYAGVIDVRAAEATLTVDHCTFYNVIPMNTDFSCVSKITLDKGTASNCIFMLPTAQDGIRAMRGVTATNCITFNYLKDNGTGIHSSVTQNNCVQVDPAFVDPENGNFTLSATSPALTMNDGEPIGDPRWVPAAAPAHTYTVAGGSTDLFGTAWDPANAANDMVLQEDNTYKWEKTDLELAAGAIEFKVCEDHAWTVAYPAQNYVLNIAESGIYTISIFYNPNDNNYVGALATKTGDAVVIPTVAMHGNFLGSWADTENFTIAEGDATASLTLTLAEGNYEFGMRIGGSGNWTSNGVAFTRENNAAEVVAGQGNLTLAADVAGEYTFVWTYETNNLAITFPAIVAPSYNLSEIDFVAPATADEIDADASFTVDGFTVAITDPDNKMSIDANDCRFGTATDYKMYSHRLKTGGKSSATKNFMTLTIPEAGILRLAVRTGSNSATDRNLVIVQGENTLYDQVIQESMAIKVMENETEVSVYPYVEVPVEAGTVVLSYPTNGLNFYAFVLKAAGGETPVVLDAPDAAPAAPTYAAYQVHAAYSATYNADCNFGEWGSGTQYTQEEFGKKYVTTNLGYFGLDFTGMDCSAMEALHLDVWAASDITIHVVPIHGGTEVGVFVTVQGQQWNAIDIPLSEFEGVTNWSNVYQIKIDEARELTFWLNNVYFYTTQEKTVDLVDGYYLIGNMNGWDIHNLTADHLFAVNPDNEAEYMLHYTLAEGNEFKVVAVANNELGAWYPGEAGNYVVDFAHAGEKDIYFRPDYQGGEGWHAGCIYVEGDANANPWETWFAIGDTWNTETESYMEWDGESQKATIHINVDKYGQWRAQVKYHGPVAEEGKCYHVALKLKANNAISNVTIKYQDNVEMVYVNDAALAANVEFVFDTIVAGLPNGNGIMVLDFGFAHAGDIIEIYDVVIEETECPATRLEDGYYLIGLGMADWTVDYITADYLLTANPSNEGEYMLNITLAKDQQFKVVSVANDAIVTWYPDGMDNNYIVDANHAGATTVYFRPDGQGGEGWHYGMIYVAPTSTVDLDNIDANAPAVKIIRNGQILIIKGQKMYNVMGQTIQ